MADFVPPPPPAPVMPGVGLPGNQWGAPLPPSAPAPPGMPGPPLPPGPPVPGSFGQGAMGGGPLRPGALNSGGMGGPGMMQPNGMHTNGGMSQPGMQQPGMQQFQMPPPPGMQQQPAMQQMHQHGMQQPGMQQHGMQQPGMQQPGMQQPGMQQPGMMQQNQWGQPQGGQQHGGQQWGQQGMMQNNIRPPGLQGPGGMQQQHQQHYGGRGMMQPGMMGNMGGQGRGGYQPPPGAGLPSHLLHQGSNQLMGPGGQQQQQQQQPPRPPHYQSQQGYMGNKGQGPYGKGGGKGGFPARPYVQGGGYMPAPGVVLEDGLLGLKKGVGLKKEAPGQTNANSGIPGPPPPPPPPPEEAAPVDKEQALQARYDFLKKKWPAVEVPESLERWTLQDLEDFYESGGVKRPQALERTLSASTPKKRKAGEAFGLTTQESLELLGQLRTNFADEPFQDNSLCRPCVAKAVSARVYAYGLAGFPTTAWRHFTVPYPFPSKDV
eukprot:TRINITY_DN45809_c0_g1_i3.p1 TRINITY_DN45809_c0_g1~~TRINITY_DN45809_c0_g1_i3.p1  ORF type:complete len:489 (+),score=121.49 TRINITY_DN45809_c0_g1_i3:95-1561(+)